MGIHGLCVLLVHVMLGLACMLRVAVASQSSATDPKYPCGCGAMCTWHACVAQQKVLMHAARTGHMLLHPYVHATHAWSVCMLEGGSAHPQCTAMFIVTIEVHAWCAGHLGVLASKHQYTCTSLFRAWVYSSFALNDA
jgi:hypothetical protein